MASSCIEIARPSGFVGWQMQADDPRSVPMEAICICGTRYERTEQMVGTRDLNNAVCPVCGAGLATWCSFRVPVYRLKQNTQDGEPPNARPELARGAVGGATGQSRVA
jgi:hypothetical protein